eukprot:TRINITY_DN4752_c0_g1_i1.p1 TRINITY_DN4752_c0_g1~~TRINITY_DN4752_c0_g1_i1.p1  ORF type:complete len:449 (-),score=62.60 TRINITY_DN4752_c0_g1_i1:32-1378(-)
MSSSSNNGYVLSIQQYLNMAKVFKPEVVAQRISVDLQCKPDDSVIKSFVDYLYLPDRDSQTYDFSALNELAKSKYSRMASKGLSNTEVERVRGSDSFVKLYRGIQDQENTTSEIADESNSVPVNIQPFVSFESVGNRSDDTTLGDESTMDTKESNSRVLSILKEAQELKSQAIKSTIESVKSIETPLFRDTKKNESLSNKMNEEVSADISCPPPPTECTQLIKSSLDGREYQVSTHVANKLYTIQSMLSSEQCDKLIQLLDFSNEEIETQEKTLSANLGKFNIVRTSLLRKYVDKELPKLVWSIVKNVLPTQLEDSRKLAGVRTSMNFYRYGKGQFFSTHYDGGHRFNETGNTSEYTFVVYLNDNFKGGATRFCNVPEIKEPKCDVAPKQGSVLVFRQRDMKHCGAAIGEGTKYILQGMVMYGPIRINKAGGPVGVSPNSFKNEECDC